MLGIINNFIRKFSPKPFADSLRKTPETNPSYTLIGRQETDSLNVPSGIENNQSNRLGFMEGEGRVPDDFNTMGSKDIENFFLNDR